VEEWNGMEEGRIEIGNGMEWRRKESGVEWNGMEE
jgi:hypothetical protein